MQQHLELGQFLRDRYKNFLNESYDRHEVRDGPRSSLLDLMTSRLEPGETNGDLLMFERRGLFAMLMF